MACYEDFDSDLDEELAKDIVAVPINHSKPGKATDPIANQESNFVVQQAKDDVKNSSVPYSVGIERLCDAQLDEKGKCSFGSDPFLSDSCRDQQCSCIEEAWHTHGIFSWQRNT